MFPHRKFHQDLDDTDEDNEASLQFNKKAKELLKSIAPTKEEKSCRSMSKGPPVLQAIRKKLNFDESFVFNSPSIARQKGQLSEYEEQLEQLRRENNSLKSELHQCNRQNEEHSCTINELRNTISNLRQQLSEAQIDQRSDNDLHNSMINQIHHDEICTTAHKYIVWFNIAMDQLRIAEKILIENSLMTSTNKKQILSAIRMLPVDKDADTLASLASGSIQNFPLLESLKTTEENDCGDVNAPVASSSNFRHVQLSPIPNESSEDLDNSQLLNTTIINSSISSVDIDYKERITYLEQQNSMLLDKIKVCSHRAQTALVLEEEKRSLEIKTKLLDEKLEKALAELAHLRKKHVEDMFERVPDGDTYGKALLYVDRITELEVNCKKTETELFSVKNKLNEYEEYAKQLEECINNRNLLVESLNGQLQQKDINYENISKKLESITNDYNSLNQYNNQLLSELQQERDKHIQAQVSLSYDADNTIHNPSGFIAGSSDAGNTTQILHLVDNPFAQAHDCLIAEERTRKRKASGDIENDEIKRSKDEEISQLQRQLSKAEKEREVTMKIHDDTLQKMKKYREFTTCLTGCQIKVTDFDQGLVTVSSLYDDNNKEFVFKVGLQNVDLLDMGTSSSIDTNNWNELAEYYIGVRSSVPGFLSKLTLTLEEQRELDSVERTHMFSVIQE